MRLDFYEPIDPYGDPLTNLLRREEAEDEADILESQYRAALAVTKRSEKDRDEVQVH